MPGINIVRCAQRLTGISEVYAVFGGFHLYGPLFEPIIGPTCDALAELRPSVLVPSHVTGWGGAHNAARFPEAYLQSLVGTTYVLWTPVAASHRCEIESRTGPVTLVPKRFRGARSA